jgi:hypothetical protein
LPLSYVPFNPARERAIIREMRRQLRPASLALFALLIGFVLAWASSYRWSNTLVYERWYVDMVWGKLGFAWYDRFFVPLDHGFSWAHDSEPEDGRDWPKVFVFYRTTSGPLTRITKYLFYIPMWLPTLMSAALWWWVHRRSRDPLPGHCRNCGYDLRASPQRCPECGAPAITSKT